MQMTETELLAAVVDLIDQVDARKGPRALLWHHCGDSRRCVGQRGFPDLFIAGRHGIIIAELKSATGDTSADQDLWAWMLSQALWLPSAVVSRVWIPYDLETGLIRAELEAIV